MSENDEVPGLEAIREYREIWEMGAVVPNIVDAKIGIRTSYDPRYGWDDITTGAASAVLSELGDRLYLDDVDTPEELRELIDYYKSFTNALSADEGLSRKVDCTEFISAVHKLYRKVKLKPNLSELTSEFNALEASKELDRIREIIPKEFIPASDYRSVRWNGKEFSFSTQQAEIVKKLHNASANRNPDLHQVHILEELGIFSDKTRVEQYFRKYPAWGKLIIKGKGKGTLRLDI